MMVWHALSDYNGLRHTLQLLSDAVAGIWGYLSGKKIVLVSQWQNGIFGKREDFQGAN